MNKKWIFYVLQGFAALIIVVLTLEFIFGLAGIGEQEFLKPDPLLGFSPIPNKHVTLKTEGFGRSSYNCYGLPEPERPLVKPERTYRIVVLGDSFVEAMQVAPEQNFCHLLENDLNSRNPQTHYEVMNFGVAGYSIGQMYLRLKNLGFRFHPDMVLLAVRADTTFMIQPTVKNELTTARPSFFTDRNHELIIDYTVCNMWSKSAAGKRMKYTSWLRENSRIWGVISVVVGQMSAWYQGITNGTTSWGAAITKKRTAFAGSNAAAKPEEGDSNKKAFQACGTFVDRQAYYDARDKGINYFWPTMDAIIVAIDRECIAHKCKFMIVSMPGAKGAINQIETDMFKKTADRLQVPFFDATPAFTKIPVENAFYALHFKPFGHKIFAEQIEPFVREHACKSPD